MSIDTGKAKDLLGIAQRDMRLSMCCAAPITQSYDGVICTQCKKWSASMDTNEPSDLFYLASRAAKQGNTEKAVEFSQEALRLLRTESVTPVEIELRLSKEFVPAVAGLKA